MIIVLMVFGTNPSYHRQAYLAILSLLKQTTQEHKIVMLTDAPQYYNYLNTSIDIHTITQEVLTDWKGPHDFFWRIKIKGIEYAHLQYPQHDVLYLDTDTFLFGNLSEIQHLIASGKSVMHLQEGLLFALNSKTIKVMWKQLKGKTYQHCKINAQSGMWNAGVIGFSATHASSYLKDILAICDGMLADKVRPKLIEQFAFSLRLQQHSNILPANHIFGHYWGNKAQWDGATQEFLSTAFMKGQSLDDVIHTLDVNYWLQLPIYEKRSSFGKNLLRFVTKRFYQPQNVTYFNSGPLHKLQ